MGVTEFAARAAKHGWQVLCNDGYTALLRRGFTLTSVFGGVTGRVLFVITSWDAQRSRAIYRA